MYQNLFSTLDRTIGQENTTHIHMNIVSKTLYVSFSTQSILFNADHYFYIITIGTHRRLKLSSILRLVVR